MNRMSEVDRVELQGGKQAFLKKPKTPAPAAWFEPIKGLNWP